MARSENDLKFPEQFINRDKMDVLQKLPPPAGKERAAWNAELATGAYYANVKVYANGRRVVEWYKYGEGGGPGNPDPISATSEDIVPDVKAEWDKEEARPTPAAPTRNINGVPHQVTGKDENGQDIWSPVQTATGPAQPTGGTSATQQRTAREEAEIAANAALPPDQDPRAETNAERAARAERVIKEQGQAARQAQLDADAKAERERQAARQAAADARAEAAANKPGAITLKPDGKGGSVAVRAMPDGSVQTTPLPNVPSEATRVTVDGVVYEKGPDGQFAPARGIPLPGASARNIEPFVPDPAAGPDLGLGAWAAGQRAKIGTPADAGGITQSEYDQAAKAAHDQASVYIQNVTSSQTVRRQAEQDERSQRNDLSNQSAADYARAQGEFNQLWKYMDPNLNTSNFIPAIMAEQAKFRSQREGTARPAPALHPMFQALPAQAGVAKDAVPVQWGAQPAPVPDASAAEHAASIAANPVFRPQPEAVVPATPPPLGQGQDLSGPVSMGAGGPVSAWAGPMVQPPAQPPAPTAQPVLALPSGPPQPTFDPLPTAGRLAQLGLPADVIAMTMQEMGLMG